MQRRLPSPQKSLTSDAHLEAAGSLWAQAAQRGSVSVRRLALPLALLLLLPLAVVRGRLFDIMSVAEIFQGMYFKHCCRKHAVLQ